MSPLMKLMFVLLLAFDLNVDAGKIDNSREQLLTLSNAINDFSLDLFKKTTEKIPGKSIIMSPLSADIALALLSMGAQGETQIELNAALHLPNAEFIKTAFATMINSLNSKKDITLNIANKVFIKKGIPLSPQFKTLATDVFGSEIENVDFDQPKEASQTINSWVEEKTSNKIKDFILPSTLNVNTVMFLLNAIYFKANWQNIFDEYDTYDSEFILTKTSKKTIKMMEKTENMQYFENSEWNAKMVELPYQNNDLSMVIILPNEVDGLNKVINKIGSGADLTSAFKSLNQTLVNLHLPQFKIESSINLVDLLRKVGIEKIFEPGAELGGLLQNNGPLSISDVIQKAVIEVGENGTVAAVATAIKLQFESEIVYPEPPEYVYVDHPFLFCIKTRENIPIFIGQYTGVKL